LRGGDISCISNITLKGSDGNEVPLQWRQGKPDEAEITLPLQFAKPGALTLQVAQYGVGQAQAVHLHAFAEAARPQRFAIHEGESQGVLTGSRLDEVASLSLEGIEFLPGKLSTNQGNDELAMVARDAQGIAVLKQGEISPTRIALNDGRFIDVSTSIDAPRPRVTLIAKSVQALPGGGANIQLTSQDEVPQDAKLTFSVRAQSPATFTHDQKIEVATTDESSSATLSAANGGLTLADSKVAIASLDPMKALGTSAFGPLQFRAVANGIAGDWQPLATLVRLPVLMELKCPATPEMACKLSGSNLFLVDSLAGDPGFAHPVLVPDGFPGFSLPVPHPTNGALYVKLRDDPAVISRAFLEAQQLPPAPDEAERAASRRAAATPEVTSKGGAQAPEHSGDPQHANEQALPAPIQQ
jgi:hypothetical protein